MAPESACSLEHLLNLQPHTSENHSRLTEEIFAQVVIWGLPEKHRVEFFPNATIDNQGLRVINRGNEFVRRGAINHLMERLAQQPKVDESIRNRINGKKAAMFWNACLARNQPLPPQSDPVVSYGWDRTRDRETIGRLQDECADVMISCYCLGFLRAVPEMESYIQDSERWYDALSEHVTSAQYQIYFALEILAGVQRVQVALNNLFAKLVALYQEIPEAGRKIEPQQIVAILCRKVGIPALETVECDDGIKADVRNFLESVEKVQNTSPGLRFQLEFFEFGDQRPFRRLQEKLHQLAKDGSFLESILQALILSNPLIKLFAAYLANLELNNKISKFVEECGQPQGLCQ